MKIRIAITWPLDYAANHQDQYRRRQRPDHGDELQRARQDAQQNAVRHAQHREENAVGREGR